MIDAAETDFPDWLNDSLGLLGPDTRPVGGERLRQWGLSEVWRVRLDGPAPRSVIVKRGTGEMAEEARRYRELVVPLGIAAAGLLAARGGAEEDGDGEGRPVVLILEDVGPDTLEQRPTAEGYQEAVRTLARMRAVAARRMAQDPAIGMGLRWTTDDFADTARRAATALAALRPDLTGAVDAPAKVLVERLDRLSGQPDTIVHGDFQGKNLIHGPRGSVIPVDWPGAYVHPHLGDLYLLIREARNHEHVLKVDADDLIGVFARTAGADPASVFDQMMLGGLCWTLLALRWVVQEGIGVVPESADWVDGLAADLRSLAGLRSD